MSTAHVSHASSTRQPTLGITRVYSNHVLQVSRKTKLCISGASILREMHLFRIPPQLHNYIMHAGMPHEVLYLLTSKGSISTNKKSFTSYNAEQNYLKWHSSKSQKANASCPSLDFTNAHNIFTSNP